MKKFFITVVILIALAGTAFFFGWAQLTVPSDAYGVMRSKTHGVYPHPIRGGEFSWMWYRLIPTNTAVSVYRLKPVTRTISARGTLPSGEVYAAFTGGGVDFSWELNASFSFSLRPESLVSVISQNSITGQEELAAWQNTQAQEIEAFITRSLNSGTNEETESVLSGLSEELETRVTRQFPTITNFTCRLTTVRFPDFALYRHSRGLYENYLAAQQTFIADSLSQQAEDRINTQLRLNELERIGELLLKYPPLLEYLAQGHDAL